MPRKIFIVIPSDTIRHDIAQMLSYEGYVTAQAANLAELEQLPPIVPDLIIWDISKPETNRNELLKYLKDDPGKAKSSLILITSEDHPLDTETAKILGADSFVTKPFHASELLKQIKRVFISDYRRC